MITQAMKILLEGISGQVQSIITSEENKKYNDVRLQKQFEEIGRFIEQYVGQDIQDEFAENLKQMFSKKEMGLLYKNISEMPGFIWGEELGKKLQNLCMKYDVDPSKTNKFINSFEKMVFFSLSQHNESKAMQMFLGSAFLEVNDKLEKIGRSGDDVRIIVDDTRERVEEILKLLQDKSGNCETYGISQTDKIGIHAKEESKNRDAKMEKSGLSERDVRSTGSGALCKSQINWTIQYKHYDGLFGNTEKRQENIRALTVQWREERIHYPNWFILPAKMRDKVRMYNQCEELLQCEDILPLSEQLEFGYELFWRYETAMLSYSPFMQHHMYRIWYSVLEQDDWTQKEQNIHWYQIGLFLLREYREDLKTSQWEEVYRVLKQHTEFINYGECYLTIEEIAQSFASMNILKTIALINTFSPPELCYDVRLRLCGIKAECGMLEKARQETEKLAEDIRTRIISAKTSEEDCIIYLKSILPCVLHLQGLILQAINPLDEEIRDKVQVCEQERLKWSEFYSYDDEKEACDQAVFTWLERKYELPLFELNRETVPIVVSEQFCLMAYSFYRILEKSGLPLHLGHVSLVTNHRESMVESIIESHVQVGWQLLLRTSDKKDVERAITRSRLLAWSREQKDQFFDYVIHALDCNVDMIKDCNPGREGNIYTSIAQNALIILERLSSVATLPQQDQLIRLMIRLIDKNAIKEFRALDSFIAKVMENASEQSKAAAINSLLNCSGDERYHIESEGQLDPFDVFTQRGQAKVLYDKTYVEPTAIEKLLECSESSDTKYKAMIARLGKLNEWEKLSTDQQNQFGKVLWNNVGESTGLPDLPNYYVHTFLQWAHPQDIDVKTAVKQYFFREEQKKRLFESVRMKSFGEVSVLKQLCILNENISHFWKEEEIGHIISLLHDFWEEEKKQASNGFLHNGFAERMFKDNSRLIIRALASFPRGKVQMLPSAKITQLKELLASLRSYGISTFEAEVNCLGKTENRDFLEVLVDALYEVDTYITVSAALAIQKYLVEFTKAEEHIFLLRELLKGIRAGKNPGLITFLIVVHNYFYSNHQELPGYILKNVEQALICVEKRTAYSGGDSEKELKQKVEIRFQGAALAFQLYLYEKSWKNGQHSEASLLWRDICCGIKAEDEFVEVRNVWIELP